MAIPKLLHQTLKSASQVHPILQENIDHLRSLNPTWEYRLYDDADIRKFISAHYSTNVLRYYEQLNPIYGPARADFFRYLLMYTFGGVYLDIKSTLSRPLDDVIAGDEYLLSHWNNKSGQRYQGWGLHAGLGADGELQQWHLVAPPEHPFLKAAILAVMWNIDNYHPYLHGTGKMGVLRVTGPIAYTLAIRPIQDSHPHQLVDIEALGFVYSVTGGPGRELSHEALFPHHYKHSRDGQPIVRGKYAAPPIRHSAREGLGAAV